MPDMLHLKELMLQSLEHERGGVVLYKTALQCALDAGLKEEWGKYLRQTENHVVVLVSVCDAMGIDAHEMTPGRQIVHHKGKALAVAMQMALAANDPPAAERVACECIVLAETKDHFDWELLGECAKALPDPAATALREAYEAVEDEEDEHLYHTRGWCRELWLKVLGLDAVLPPPEEKRNVQTALDADGIEQERKQHGSAHKSK